MILVIAEHRGGRLNRASWEVITAAQQLAAGEPITVVLPGADVGTAGEELSTAAVAEVVLLQHAALEPYTCRRLGPGWARRSVAAVLAEVGGAAAHLPDARLRARAGRRL